MSQKFKIQDSLTILAFVEALQKLNRSPSKAQIRSIQVTIRELLSGQCSQPSTVIGNIIDEISTEIKDFDSNYLVARIRLQKIYSAKQRSNGLNDGQQNLAKKLAEQIQAAFEFLQSYAESELENNPISSNINLTDQFLITRYPHLEAPAKCFIDQPFSLFVKLLVVPLTPTDTCISIQDTGDLTQLPDIEIVLRSQGLDIVNGNDTRTLSVDREGDSEERYVLIPRISGEHLLRVDFYQHGKRIGTVRHAVQVIVAIKTGSSTSTSSENLLYENSSSSLLSESIESIYLKSEATSPPPNLELCIVLETDLKTLSFTLHSTVRSLGYHHTRQGQIVLRESPLDKMKAVYNELGNISTTINGLSSTLAQRRLEALGNQLWDELIPDSLKTEYWQFRLSVNTLLITSDEPWVPWEMIKPYRFTKDGERQDAPFWCQQFTLSRWLSGPGTVDRLYSAPARAIASNQSNLPAVAQEVLFIQQLHSLDNSIQSLEPYSKCSDVLDWMEQGNFLIAHFACHGMFDDTLPNNSAIQLSDGLIYPSDLRCCFSGIRNKPLVFINACHGGRTGFTFTGLGGWAEKLVRSARVGAFIGAMWEVDDSLALQFAECFYTGWIKENRSIAEAFQIAREKLRVSAPHSSTWLAYVLYADPETLKDS